MNEWANGERRLVSEIEYRGKFMLLESISLHYTVGFTSWIIISSGQELVLFNNQYVLSAYCVKA